MQEYDTVLIIDAGSQYCKLIDRTVRELSVKTAISSLDITHQEILKNKYKAIIISGGPSSVIENDENINFDQTIFDLGIPILGICYGMQLIHKIHGGATERSNYLENAQTPIKMIAPCALYDSLAPDQIVLMTHSDFCKNPSNFFVVNAITSENMIAGISNEEAKIYGVQFHPEVNLTINGLKMFKNFLFKICNLNANFNQQNKLDLCYNSLNKIRSDQIIVVLTSGGVDSSVCAFLVNKLKNKKIFFYIDNGFSRENEGEKIKNLLKSINIDVHIIDAGFYFYNASTFVQINKGCVLTEVGPLRVINLPEFKRFIIGDTFILSVINALNKLNVDFNNCIIVQGTLRPDLIESGSCSVSKHAHTIKTHHNDSNLARELRACHKIIEPLADFHKDEVRSIAQSLNFPPEILNRRPFPGPGLAIRILCQERPKIFGIDQRFDEPILAGIIANYHSRFQTSNGPVYKFIKESLAENELQQLIKCTNVNYTLNSTLLPIMSVGVQGDRRSYKNCIALSTNSTEINWSSLEIIARIIPKICTSINRVVFAFGPAINYEITNVTLTFLSPESLKLIRNAHSIVEKILDENNCNISQFPVILIPIHFDLNPTKSLPPMKRSLVLRPFITKDFMTGKPAIPNRDIDERVVNHIKDKLMEIPTISRVLYDLSHKPPATTEWE